MAWFRLFEGRYSISYPDIQTSPRTTTGAAFVGPIDAETGMPIILVFVMNPDAESMSNKQLLLTQARQQRFSCRF